MTTIRALLNPWLLLGLLAAFLGFGAWSYHRGDVTGAARVQSAWTASDNQVLARAVARSERVRDAEAALRSGASKVDGEMYAKNEDLARQLAAANWRLRSRPERPAVGAGVPAAAAGPGAQGGCTGAELYADDGRLLAGEAYVAQRIRNQRDACYLKYEGAQAELRTLGK